MGQYATFCTVLTAYAESDFNPSARSEHPVSASGFYSEGVFQQTLPWWTNDHWDVRSATNAFLDEFRPIHKDPVLDAWEVQMWDATPNTSDFYSRKETLNYIRRLPLIDGMIASRHVPS